MARTEKRFLEFEAELRTLIDKYRDTLGPSECPIHGMDTEACECPGSDGIVAPGMQCTEWFLGSAWMNFEDGVHAYNYATHSGALLSHTIGLMSMIQMKLEESIP